MNTQKRFVDSARLTMTANFKCYPGNHPVEIKGHDTVFIHIQYDSSINRNLSVKGMKNGYNIVVPFIKAVIELARQISNSKFYCHIVLNLHTAIFHS